jgi:membrane fusion protein (multidrug efflux system)
MEKHKAKLKWVVLFALVCAVAAGVYVFIHRNEESTDDAAIEGRSVAISPKVAGYVKELHINDNQLVKAGDILLQIDPADYIIRRDRAKAALDAAKAQVISANATLKKSKSDLSRMQRLSNQARSQEQLEQVASDAQAAQAVVDQLKAQADQAEADLAQAEKDLADTSIIAPMDGYITKRGVERGNYVQPGQQLASLAGTEIWVVANFKETQLKHIRPGQMVDIAVDAFPDIKLAGKVDSIQLGTGSYFSAFPPENATGNYVKIIQRVPVKIVFNNPPDNNIHLGLGMSVIPVVHTDSAGSANAEAIRD